MEIYKIIGALLLGLFIIYVSTQSYKEGMTNNKPSEEVPIGEYVSILKAQVTKLSDSLLLSKYKSEYENAIIMMDDYIGFSMLKHISTMKTLDKNNLDYLISLKNAKDSLNIAMTFLDKQ